MKQLFYVLSPNCLGYEPMLGTLGSNGWTGRNDSGFTVYLPLENAQGIQLVHTTEIAAQFAVMDSFDKKVREKLDEIEKLLDNKKEFIDRIKR